MVLILLCYLLTLCARLINAWQSMVHYDFVIDKIEIRENDEANIRIFEGVYESRDYFTLLSSNRNKYIGNAESLFIGARDHLYELSVPDLKLLSTLKWSSTHFDKMQCLNRSIISNKEECDNYVRLFLKLDDETLKVCATNSLNPKCRFYFLKKERKLDEAIVYNETSGLGFSPLKAYEDKYVYNYVDANKQLYAANTLDLNRHFTTIGREFEQERVGTNVNDNNWINKADFVSSFSTSERIFFVFNEEDESLIESRQTRRVSRISHICLNDNGSAALNSLRNIWTTFLKTRLSCVYDAAKNSKLDAEFNENQFLFEQTSSLFYFDEIKSISELYTSQKLDGSNATYFYAVFTTTKTSITASAICMFTLDQIMSSFNGEYQNSDLGMRTVPSPRPSECPDKLTYQHIVFSRKNILMQNEIVSEAILVESSSSSRFTSISVDFEAKNQQNQINDVIFVGTDAGNILTFVLETFESTEPNKLNAKLIYSENRFLFNNEEKSIQSNSKNPSIQNVNFHSDQTSRNLIVMTQNKLISSPAHFCSTKNSLKQCDNSLYPYCVWSPHFSTCLDYFNDESFELNLKSILNFTTEKINSTNLTKNSNEVKQQQEKLAFFQNNQIVISLNLLMFVASVFFFLLAAFLIAICFIVRKSSERIERRNKGVDEVQWDRQIKNEMVEKWTKRGFCLWLGRKNDSAMNSECNTSQSSISESDEKAQNKCSNYETMYSNVFKKRPEVSKNNTAFTITGLSRNKLANDYEQRYIYLDRESMLKNREYEAGGNDYCTIKNKTVSDSSNESTRTENSSTKLVFNSVRQETDGNTASSASRLKLKYSESLSSRPKSAILQQNNFNSLRKYYI